MRISDWSSDVCSSDLRIGGVPQANRDMMRAIADVYDCYALCCDRNVVEVLRATVTDYEVIDSYQLSDPITFATHVSREYDDIAKSILVRWGIDLLHVRPMAWHSLNLIDLAGGIGIPMVCSFQDYYSICPRSEERRVGTRVVNT